MEQKSKWVLVECISTFRERYMVEIPAGKEQQALDIVRMNGAKEFSQVHIGEQIVSHRDISETEALELCRKDNDYADWDDETTKSVFFTSIADIEKEKNNHSRSS